MLLTRVQNHAQPSPSALEIPNSHLSSRNPAPLLTEAGYSSHSPYAKSLDGSLSFMAIARQLDCSAIMSNIQTHPNGAKLYKGWGTHTLVDDVMATPIMSGAEDEVFVGRRLPIMAILETKLSTTSMDEVGVLVSRPESMVDKRRKAAEKVVRA